MGCGDSYGGTQGDKGKKEKAEEQANENDSATTNQIASSHVNLKFAPSMRPPQQWNIVEE